MQWEGVGAGLGTMRSRLEADKDKRPADVSAVSAFIVQYCGTGVGRGVKREETVWRAGGRHAVARSDPLREGGCI